MPLTAASASRVKWHTAAVLDLAAFCRFAGKNVRIVSASEDGTARVWTLDQARTATGGAKMRPWNLRRWCWLVTRERSGRQSITSDGQTIVTGGDDGTVRFWGARDGKPQGLADRHRSHRIDPQPSPSARTGR